MFFTRLLKMLRIPCLILTGMLLFFVLWKTALNLPSLPDLRIPQKTALNWPSLPDLRIPQKTALNKTSLPDLRIPQKTALNWPSLPDLRIPQKTALNWPSLPDLRIPQKTALNWPSLSDLRIPQQLSNDLPGCLAIFSGDVEGKKDKLEMLPTSRKRKTLLSEDFYLNVTQDCPSYIERRGFFTEPLSEEEKDFPIAYSMVIHEKIEMFERLLRAVYTPQNIYCVHVDQKSPKEFQKAVEAITSCFPNVFIASKLERVIYTSWSRVQADLNCMKDLLNSPIQWRYLLNTCGTDFPIKTNGEIVQALKALNGRNSMETEATNDYKKGRWQYHYDVTNTSVIRTDVKKSPPPISSPMFQGNAYIVVTRAFMEHVMQDKEVQQLLEWERDTHSPEEHLWATLQRMPSVPGSTPAHSKYDTSDLLAIARVVKWSELAGDMKNGAPYYPCTGIYRREVCVYGAGDLPWLMRQHHLFANKFDPLVDDVAIRCLESVLYHKALGHDPLLTDHTTL